MKRLFGYLNKYRTNLVVSIILVTISSLTSLVLPLITKSAINDGIMGANGPDYELMRNLGLIMLVIALVGLLTGVVNSFVSANLAQNTGADLRKSGFERIQQFAYQDIEKFSTSNLVVRLTNDVNQIQTAVMLLFTSLLRMPILLIGSFILAVYTIPELWYVVLIMIILVIVVLGVVMSRAIPYFKKTQRKIETINTVIKENFEGVRVVKSFVKEDYEQERFDNECNDLVSYTRSIGYMFSVVLPMFMLIANMATVLVIYLVKDLAITNPEVIGSTVSYITYLGQVMMAIIIGGMVLMQFSRSMVSLNRFYEVLDTLPSIVYNENGFTDIDGTVKFDDVSFIYPEDDHASLHNITFNISKGEKVGIVGTTGSGKSTLVHLLMRLYEPTSGNIYLGNNNIKDYTKDSLRKDLSIVLQRPLLFSGSIEDNIKLGRDYDLCQIENAAHNAQAFDFINNLDDRFGANVQQRGSNFSGGQKQRLSITRSIVKKSKILVLDDSTSALDSKSEKLVKEALFSEYPEQTMFIIAQKITSVIDADKIIVLKDGYLDAIGTHKELLKSSEVYQEIYATQKGRH